MFRWPCSRREALAPAHGRKLTVSFLHRPYATGPYATGLDQPRDYANLVLALHWLMWPVILVLWSRKFFIRLGK